jgi:hypothetical protein
VTIHPDADSATKEAWAKLRQRMEAVPYWAELPPDLTIDRIQQAARLLGLELTEDK